MKKAAAITNNAAEKQNQNLEDLLISSRTFIVHLHRPGLTHVGFLLGQERASRGFLRLRAAELIRKWLAKGEKNVARSGTFSFHLVSRLVSLWFVQLRRGAELAQSY